MRNVPPQDRMTAADARRMRAMAASQMQGMPAPPMPAPPMPAPPMPAPQMSAPPMQGMKKGGSVSSRADGCARKGHTKGKML